MITILSCSEENENDIPTSSRISNYLGEYNVVEDVINRSGGAFETNNFEGLINNSNTDGEILMIQVQPMIKNG